MYMQQLYEYCESMQVRVIDMFIQLFVLLPELPFMETGTLLLRPCTPTCCTLLRHSITARSLQCLCALILQSKTGKIHIESNKVDRL